jgi:hypothetical protein
VNREIISQNREVTGTPATPGERSSKHGDEGENEFGHRRKMTTLSRRFSGCNN